MITMNEIRSLFHNGLIKQNTGLVQLLGLCPLLAISNNVVNGLSLGIATALVMAASSGAVSSVRHFVPNEIRIPVFILIIAALVTVIDLAMNAFVHPLYLVLGIFIPLITTNCIVLARAGSVSIRWSIDASVLNRKCGSTCACIAAMRASTTWRFSVSASAASVACAAWASAWICFL